MVVAYFKETSKYWPIGSYESYGCVQVMTASKLTENRTHYQPLHQPTNPDLWQLLLLLQLLFEY